MPEPFIWGAYNGKEFLTFDDTLTFIDWFANQHVLLYAHNGGKFDFMFLIPHIATFLNEDKIANCRIINGRLVEIPFGRAKLRDSWSIIPTPLGDFSKADFAYHKLEKDVRHLYRDDIVTYLKSDCVNLYDIVHTFRTTAGRGVTIAGNALAYAKKLEIDVGKTNRHFDLKFRPYYYGGRCEALSPGQHGAVTVLDIKSAYPFAMLHQHPTGIDYRDWGPAGVKLQEERLNQCFLSVNCTSDGAFPSREKGDLSFASKRGTFFVSGWEFNVARRHNLISEVNVERCIEFYGEITFKDYVDHWFASKESAEKSGQKALRHVCKIMLNSLYGKLCQNPIRYQDYQIVEALTTPDYENGWSLAHQGADYEIHARPSLWHLQQKYGDDWHHFSIYYNVATGASITGFTRAHLLDAICRVGKENVVYCDTDSIMVEQGADLSKLDLSGGLGTWTVEGEGTEAYIAGRKLYAVKLKDGDEKLASKGANLSFSEIKRVTKGEELTYNHDAPTFKLDGSATFQKRRIKRTALERNKWQR